MIMSQRLARTLLLIAVTACGCSGSDSTALDPPGAPTPSELAQATYSDIMDRPVTLAGGRWEGEPFVAGGASRPSVGLIEHFRLTGDLDGDGLDEAVALVWESSGGSGTRLHLAVMGRRHEEVENLGTTLIGDRVQVRSGAIESDRITLDIVRAGPEDAACCPTQKALVTWALTEDGLTRTAEETTGTVSLTDLGGVEWTLVELGRDHALPEDVEISLVFQDDRVSGTSGCNTYFAGVSTPGPGNLAFNGMGATRMVCPEPIMELERRYLQALAGASSYAFLAGRLAINCETDSGSTVLLFSPREVFTGVSADAD
jgi:heat shock protein HslJ